MNKIIGFIIFVCLVACTNMSDVYQEYLDRGEKIYIGRVDSIRVYPGNQRIKLEWLLDADPKLKECVILWNNAKDSVIVAVDRENQGPRKMSAILNDLSEGGHVFELFTRDIYGNVSLKNEKSGTVYGSRYAAGLLNCKLLDAAYAGNDYVISWKKAEKVVGIEFAYIDNDNGRKKINVPLGADRISLTTFKPGSEYEYRAMYLPEENALDTFYSASSVGKFPEERHDVLDRTGWEVSDYSSYAPDCDEPSSVLDGNIGTFWHSAYSPQASFPHHLTIDMKEVYNLSAIEVTRDGSYGNRDIKHMIFYVSIDGVDFVRVGELDFPNGDPLEAKLTFDTHKARYIKCLVDECHNPARGTQCSIAEIDVTGKKVN